MLELLLLPPMMRALAALLMGGVCFPLCGVMVLRLDLVPLRYALMHGVILGGAISLAFGIPEAPVSFLTNLLVVWMVLALKGNKSMSSAASMVFTMGLASLIMHVFDVPSKDSMQLLWGSPYALRDIDLILLAALCLFELVYLKVNFGKITAIFFDKDIANSLGVKVKFHYYTMVVVVALVVAMAMRLIGALLIDALLILPVLIAARVSSGSRQLFMFSAITGLILSIGGYFLSLFWDFPLSATIALLAAVFYALTSFSKGSKKLRSIEI
ncbi:MAG: metal ABC transporter permease [Spirochaetia bacterium]|jgi:zinc transport system permease protein|nr:metal ABC transporter permease [Spirochaetia bacterium]